MNFESVRSLISAGLGIGFWPEYSWDSIWQKSTNVALLPIKSPDCKRDIIITYNPQFSDNPIVKDFYEFLIQFAMDCKEEHERNRQLNGRI